MGSTSKKEKIAIVGGGITGLSTAYYLTHGKDNDVLKTQCDISLYESSSKIGGHAYTVSVKEDDDKIVDMDIGAMVFNKKNYPNFTELLSSLKVGMEESDMSLCISLDNGNVEWNSNGNGHMSVLASLAPTMLRFHNHAEKWFEEVTANPNDPRRFITVEEFLCRHNYPSKFATYYLLPMMAALWSSSLVDVLRFPMEHLVGFLRNHCMLQLFNRPQWLTFEGRSKRYVDSIEKQLKDIGVGISTDVGISYMKQSIDGEEIMYELFDSKDTSLGKYHRVVFACPAPIIHSIINHSNTTTLKDEMHDKTELLSLLSDIKAASNTVYLHSDDNLMPKNKSNWSSWNCIGSSENLDFRNKSKNASSVTDCSKRIMEGSEVGFGSVFTKNNGENEQEETPMKECYITYYLNKLQNLKTTTNYYVSLNPHILPSEKLIHDKYIMTHPQFTLKSQDACYEIQNKYQGQYGLYYGGAWMLGYGFHEDGCRSGRGIANKILEDDLFFGKPPMNTKNAHLPPPINQNALTTTKISSFTFPFGIFYQIYQYWTNTLPKQICKRLVHSFLSSSITQGTLELHSSNSSDPTIFGEPNSSNKGKNLELV